MSILLQTDQMPRDGQFVAYWVYQQAPFSMTFMWYDGVLLAYDTFADDWVFEHGFGDNDSSFLPDAEEVFFVQARP